MRSFKLFLCISMLTCASAHGGILEEYYSYKGIPEHQDFLYDVLKDSVYWGSFANIDDIIMNYRIPFDHDQVHNKHTLYYALEKKYYPLARCIITTHTNMAAPNHYHLLYKILIKYKKESQSFTSQHHVITTICPLLIKYGVSLNCKNKEGTLLKFIITMTLTMQNGFEKAAFNLLIFMMLKHGASPVDDCDPKNFVSKKISRNIFKALDVAYDFYNTTTPIKALVQKAHRENLLTFLTAVAYTNNKPDHNSRARDVLWAVHNHAHTERNPLIKYYDPHDARNKKYRNGYHAFTNMYMLYDMYNKRQLCDARCLFE